MRGGFSQSGIISQPPVRGGLGDGSFYTNFPTIENPLREGPVWFEGETDAIDWSDFHVTVDGAVGTFDVPGLGNDRYADNIAFIKPAYRAFTNNQFAQGTVFRAAGYNGNGGAHELELTLRASYTTGNWIMYETLFGIAGATNGYISMVRWDGPLTAYTPIYDPGLGSLVAPANGEVFRVELIGNLLSAYRNGSLIHTQDVTTIGGATYSSGQPGMGTWPADGAQHDNAGWRDFRAGNL